MAAPTSLTFPTVAYNSIILNWTPGLGSTDTLIIRKQGSIPTNKEDGTEVYLDNGNAFIDTGLTTDTQYCYALYGTDGTEYTESIAGCTSTITTGLIFDHVVNGSYALDTFTLPSAANISSTSTWIVPEGVTRVRCLIVGGGGGGGYTYGTYYASTGGRSGTSGGGGAGGFIDTEIDVEPNTQITITVGNGAKTKTLGDCGGLSKFGDIIAYGGISGAGPKVGGVYTYQGGSGGGGNNYYSPTTGTPGQGNPGGASINGGGGGGAGAAGNVNGAGGIGKQSDITGTLTYYAGGGGGSDGKVGGSGGGGTGCPTRKGVSDGYPSANASYYGGGGGAGGSDTTWARDGGYGYHGIVIIRYDLP
jgi:hypothetical protein